MTSRSPLARARGLGAANTGVTHWWRQRLSAVALVPLSLWFVAAVVCRAGGDRADAVAWLSSPVTAVLMSLYLGAAFYHSQAGLQEIIEDYVHAEGLKLAALVSLQFINVLLAAGSIFAVLWLALGGSS